jgi:hypothetical protein
MLYPIARWLVRFRWAYLYHYNFHQKNQYLIDSGKITLLRMVLSFKIKH